MTFRRAAALAFGLCLVGAASHAQDMSGPSDGPYLRLEGGWNHIDNLSGQSSVPPFNFSTSEDDNYIVGGAVGYAFEPWRVDFGFDYRNNPVSGASVPGLGAGPANGHASSLTGMLNGYYDFSVNWMGLTPYVGAGFGFTQIDLRSATTGGTPIANGTDTVPALQGMVGLRYQLSPSSALGVEYRFLNGFSPKFNTQVSPQSVPTNDYRSQSILLSFTYYLSPPSPPPPAEAAPVPAAMTTPAPAPAQPVMKGPGRNLFLVFFDFNKSTITAAGQQVLDGAAAAYQENRSVRIELTGYTDTVGTQQYNLGLSKRRADAVAAYLSKHGVPLTAMDVAWKGKEDLRVQTPDNVREPQNRRVEIILP